MLNKNNAACSICGNEYYMCRSCKDQLMLNPWKIHTDTSEHYKIFQIIRGYSIGLYTRHEAKNKFKNVDLSDLQRFRPEIQSAINSILKEEIPSSEIANTAESTDVEKKAVKRKGDTNRKDLK